MGIHPAELSLEQDRCNLTSMQKLEVVSYAMKSPPQEVDATSLLHVDALAPQQYRQVMRGKRCREPELELMLAVLKDAIGCIQRRPSTRDKRTTRRYLEARQWFMEEHSDWPFSFANICGAVGLSPQYLRAGLLQHQETRLAKNTKARTD